MLSSYINPPNINDDLEGFMRWAAIRRIQFQENCPLERTGPTFYIDADAADNSGDGLSPATAKRDLSEIQPYIDANGLEDTTISIMGGQRHAINGPVYTGSSLHSNFTITTTNGEIAEIDRFASSIFPGSSWTLVSSTTYSVPVGINVSWVKLRDDPLGDVRGTHLIRTSDTTTCTNTPYSFFYDSSSSDLYINLDGEDPNTLTIDLLESNDDSGFIILGDGVRIENLTFYGFGLENTNGGNGSSATQAHGIVNRSFGDRSNYYENIQGYYSGSHALAHNLPTGGGGRSYWKNCKVGYTLFNGTAQETLFNSFSLNGENEIWSEDLEIRYGTLKDDRWFTGGGINARGIGIFGHRGGNSSALDFHVNIGTVVKASHTPASRLGSVSNVPNFPNWKLSDSKSFFVNCRQEAALDSHGPDMLALGFSNIYKGCYFGFVPRNANPLALNAGRPFNCYILDCLVDIDMRLVGNNAFSFFNGTSGSASLQIANSAFFLRNCGITTQFFVGDFDHRNSNATTGVHENSEITNCIFACDASSSNITLGMVNTGNALRGNAFFGFTDVPGTVRGFDSDPESTILTTMPRLGVIDNDLLARGTAKRISSHDINGVKRTSSAPDIGPYDFRSKGASVYNVNHMVQSILTEFKEDVDFNLLLRNAPDNKINVNIDGTVNASGVGEVTQSGILQEFKSDADFSNLLTTAPSNQINVNGDGTVNINETITESGILAEFRANTNFERLLNTAPNNQIDVDINGIVSSSGTNLSETPNITESGILAEFRADTDFNRLLNNAPTNQMQVDGNGLVSTNLVKILNQDVIEQVI